MMFTWRDSEVEGQRFWSVEDVHVEEEFGKEIDGV